MHVHTADWLNSFVSNQTSRDGPQGVSKHTPPSAELVEPRLIAARRSVSHRWTCDPAKSPRRKTLQAREAVRSFKAWTIWCWVRCVQKRSRRSELQLGRCRLLTRPTITCSILSTKHACRLRKGLACPESDERPLTTTLAMGSGLVSFPSSTPEPDESEIRGKSSSAS
ncbi:hypothetical protein BCV70DRAFT_201664 [Testicularia cyperi]|uniref:Uncharacterized protein n=1 Tax=Testicularia cyperi TaxID=1882483 RepID=A0A317XNA5_9BASI|nr:hypothetical protein BCV70DRAFT_201664 [Testicularia cyperi]